MEVQAAAFEHDEGDEVVEVPVTIADFDGGLDPVIDGLEPRIGQSGSDGAQDVEVAPGDLLSEF